MNKIQAFVLAGVMAGGLGAGAAQAAMTVQYYQVTPNGRDFGGTVPNQTISNGVLNMLGPNGRPVHNTSSTLGAVDVDPNTGELLWWSPGNPLVNVVATGTQAIAGNSFNDPTFFAPNGSGNSNGSAFLTAIFSGQFTLAAAQTFTVTLGSDDDAYLFINGVSAGQVGGIHANEVRSFSTSLSAGSHVFQLFYADRRQTQASLSFALPDNVTVSPIPEPASWAMMIAGFGLAGTAMRRRRPLALTA